MHEKPDAIAFEDMEGETSGSVLWAAFAAAAIAMTLPSWVCVGAWADFYPNPGGYTPVFGIGAALVPTLLRVYVLTPLVILGLWSCACLLLKRLPRTRRAWSATISLFTVAALVLLLASIGALIWANKPGPILTVTGNFTAVSLLLMLWFARIRAVDLSP